jgi:hypothetical protein
MATKSNVAHGDAGVSIVVSNDFGSVNFPRPECYLIPIFGVVVLQQNYLWYRQN